MQKYTIFKVILGVLLVGVVFTQMVGVVWSRKVLLTSCQPAEVTYDSFDPYCLTISKQRLSLGTRYVIWVAKQIEPSYGHGLDYPEVNRGFFSISSDDEISQTKVVWTSDSIELETPLNTKIFIPMKNFTGGR
ncbi:MAG TPA: hypothetical protein VJJ24_02370 [Candidatus Paceibacterota bacterium]